MVEIMRFELMTPCLQGRCSPNWAIPPYDFPSPHWLRKTKQRITSSKFDALEVSSKLLPKLFSFRNFFKASSFFRPNTYFRYFKDVTSVRFLQSESFEFAIYSIFLRNVLLRKEVIQPHLPIRLPCYDLTPIINPTFGSALLAVTLLTSGVADSHGLTGGVYKTRERIHCSMLTCNY